MSHERPSLPEPDLEAPDVSFKAGVGFYLGLIVAGLTASGGLLAGASTEVILATTPGTVTGILICTLVFGDRLRDLPERLGRNRRRRARWFAPAVAFAALLLLPAVTSLAYTAAFATVTVAFLLLTTFAALGVQAMARNRYVDAVTDDEPTVTWTWQRTWFGFDDELWIAGAILMLVTGLYGTVTWRLGVGPFMTLYGLVLLAERLEFGGEWLGLEESERWNPATVRAHGSGLVVDRGAGESFIPWDAIEDVRLTDEALVLERERFDVRCDRSVIDDPEAVLEGIERARRGDDAGERTAAELESETGTESGSASESEPTLEAETGAEAELER